MTCTTPAVDIVSTADTLAATMSPTDLYFLYYALESKIKGLTFPRLTIEDTDPEGNHVTGEDRRFICPNCYLTSPDLVASNTGHRNTTGCAVDGDDLAVTFYYSGGDFRDWVHLCNHCGMPVSLPEGWTEE